MAEIWTWIQVILISKKILLLLTSLILFSSLIASTQHQQSFEVPEFDSNEQILFEFIAPFLLVYLIIQLGLYIAFQSVLDISHSPNPDTERKTARKYSSLMALVISLMVVVSPFFERISEVTFLLFGTLTNLLMLGAFLLFFYIIIAGLLGGGGPE